MYDKDEVRALAFDYAAKCVGSGPYLNMIARTYQHAFAQGFTDGGIEAVDVRSAIQSIAQSDDPSGVLSTFPSEDRDSAACSALRHIARAALAAKGGAA